MKTFDKKDVYSVLNMEMAEGYKDSEGYFGDTLNELHLAVAGDKRDTLIAIHADLFVDNDEFVFHTEGTYYKYFLPADKVKELEEKKLRAFKTLEEFTEALHKGAGGIVTFRDKANNNVVEALVIEMRQTVANSYVVLGSFGVSLRDLFEQFEWQDKDGVWRPFGVEE